MSKLKEDLAHIVKMTEVIRDGVDANSLSDTHFALSMRRETVDAVLKNLAIASEWLVCLTSHPNKSALALIEELIQLKITPPKEIQIFAGNRMYMLIYEQYNLLMPVQYHLSIREYVLAQATLVPYSEYSSETVLAYFKEKVEQYNIIKEPTDGKVTH